MIHLNFAGNDSRYTTITYSEKVRYLSNAINPQTDISPTDSSPNDISLNDTKILFYY